MTLRPFFASGEGIVPVLLAGFLSVGCVAGGLVLAAKSKKPLQWWFGAALGLCGVTILILSLVFFNRLVRLF